jgi:hypothetical protein
LLWLEEHEFLQLDGFCLIYERPISGNYPWERQAHADIFSASVTRHWAMPFGKSAFFRMHCFAQGGEPLLRSNTPQTKSADPVCAFFDSCQRPLHKRYSLYSLQADPHRAVVSEAMGM